MEEDGSHFAILPESVSSKLIHLNYLINWVIFCHTQLIRVQKSHLRLQSMLLVIPQSLMSHKIDFFTLFVKSEVWIFLIFYELLLEFKVDPYFIDPIKVNVYVFSFHHFEIFESLIPSFIEDNTNYSSICFTRCGIKVLQGYDFF